MNQWLAGRDFNQTLVENADPRLELVDRDSLSVPVDGCKEFSTEHEGKDAIAFGPAQTKHPRIGSVRDERRHHRRVGIVPGDGSSQRSKQRGVMRRHDRLARGVDHLDFDLIPESGLHFHQKCFGVHAWQQPSVEGRNGQRGNNIRLGRIPYARSKRGERDRRLLDGVRELVWLKLAELGHEFVKDSIGDGRKRHTEEPIERTHQLGIWILIMRLRAVPGDPVGRHTKPESPLLRNGNTEDELPVDEDLATANTTFVEDILGIEFIVVVVEHVASTHRPTDFFVVHSHEDDIAVERNLLPCKCQKSVELKDARPFHVDCAAAPDVAIFELAPKGIDRIPATRVCWPRHPYGGAGEWAWRRPSP